MILRRIITAILLITPVLACAQENTGDGLKRNGIFAETYLIRHDFSEGMFSLNYERTLGRRQRANLRLGIYPDFESTISFPLTLSWITKPAGTHHLEYGLGLVFRVEHFVDPYGGYGDKEWFYDLPALLIPVMYRFQKEGGFYLRAGLNVFLSWPTLPSPSISAGFRL